MYLTGEILSSAETRRDLSVGEMALQEFDHVYTFIYSRVGNRADAEDLTQQVALKALPRLRAGTPLPAVRGYLYATARTVLATFWSGRVRIPESELPDEISVGTMGQELLPPPEAAAWVARLLDGLSPDHRRVLELRFLRSYSLQEVANEMGKTVGSVKVMQLRALRAAAAQGSRIGFAH
jgi:RNA polymerase sigma-70 factor, ECF subfamily